MGNMRFKAGDRVLIKSIDWYNKNKDEAGDISCGEFIFVSHMSKFCGKILTIDVDFEDGTYLMKEDTDGFVFTNEMFDTFAEEEVERLTGNLSNSLVNEFELPEGYIFKDENGNVINATKIVLEKKKKEYPKTYEECCKIMQVARHTIRFDYDDVSSISKEGDEYECHIENTLCAFRKLLICRDAYWKIAGEEMGLGKPWEPDYTEESYEQGSPIKYVIYYTGTHITKGRKCTPSYVLSFPTPEMRDDFKENFKEEIEICKELL